MPVLWWRSYRCLYVSRFHRQTFSLAHLGNRNAGRAGRRLDVRALCGRSIFGRHHRRAMERVHQAAAANHQHRCAKCRGGDRRPIRNGRVPLGAGQLRVRSSRFGGAARAEVRLLVVSRDVRVTQRAGRHDVQETLPTRAHGERRALGAAHRNAPCRLGDLPSGDSVAWGPWLHAPVHVGERRALQRGVGAPTECDSHPMRTERRSDGRTVRIALWLLSVLPSLRLSAQTEGSVLTALPGSTRAAALGGAGAALVGDAGAIFANPAGIATIGHLGLEGSYEPYLSGTAISTAAVALRVTRLTWGFGAQALDYGSEPEIVPDPSTGGRRGMPPGASFHPYEALALTSLVYRRGVAALRRSGE